MGLWFQGGNLSEARTGKQVGAENKPIEMRAFSTRGSSGDVTEATRPAMGLGDKGRQLGNAELGDN